MKLDDNKKQGPSCLWRLLREVCTVSGSGSSFIWGTAEGFSSYAEGIEALLETGGIIHMMGILFAAPGYATTYQNRLQAVSLLTSFLSNPIQGSRASVILRSFLPEPMVLLLRGKSGSEALFCLDNVCETPELIWTAEMQSELRSCVSKLLFRDNQGKG
jgi:hypothetical protein